MPTRRLALIFVLSLVFTIQNNFAGTPEAGVFFDSHAVDRYREMYSSNPLFSTLKKEMDTVDRAKERTYLRTGVHFNDHLNDIPHVGNLAKQMALLYLFTGDKDAADLAQECVETLMKFPRWDYFLEGGTDVIGLQMAPNSAIAVGLVVEALGDRVPLEVRKKWLKVMAEKGTEASYLATYGMRYPDRVKGWLMDSTSTFFTYRPLERGIDLSRWPIILNTINLKAIPASALVLSALVYREYFGETQDTKRWLEQGIYSVGTFRDIYARDGSYNEGISYAHYTTLHLIQAVDALHRLGVTDMMDMINWSGYQDYLLEMTLSTKSDPLAIVNFSDAGTGAHSSVSFWIARETRDGLARWYGENLALMRDMWSVLYYDPTVPATPPPERTHIWNSDIGWIVGRTGYKPDDLVVALRSGDGYNHEHADRNSIIVKCFGERLVVDPMRPPYSFRDPSWKMRLTAGHSAVLIDGKGHIYHDGHEGTNASKATAKIIRHGEREGYFFWTSDATPAYSLAIPDVKSITRTVVALTEPAAVVLIDKVIKKSEPSNVQARFYAYNSDGKGSIVAAKDAFMVTRPYAQMVGVSSCAAGVTYTSAIPDIPAEKASLYPYAEVGTAKPGKEVCLVTVLLPSPAAGVSGTASVTREGTVYTAHIKVGSRSTSVKVFDSGTVPAFQVGGE